LRTARRFLRDCWTGPRNRRRNGWTRGQLRLACISQPRKSPVRAKRTVARGQTGTINDQAESVGQKRTCALVFQFGRNRSLSKRLLQWPRFSVAPKMAKLQGFGMSDRPKKYLHSEERSWSSFALVNL